MRIRRTLAALSGLALTVPLAASPALAGEVAEPPGPSGRPDVVARGLVSPLSLDVMPNGTAWFSQNFAGQLMRQREGRPARPKVTAANGAEIGAVSVAGGTVTFAVTAPSGRTVLKTWQRDDGVQRVARLSRYEKRRNPDQRNRYGLMGLSEECKQQVPPFLVDYAGIVESHPYASVSVGSTRYVADAAANAIFGVGPDGRVRTVAVLPAQDPVVVSEEAAEANQLPDCVVGKEFVAEPVPTDVERGPGGLLYVTTLPGGPEDPSLGARGGVYSVDPDTGDVVSLATGLLSATGLAVAPNGDMYVAELFGNRISRVTSGGAPVTWARATMPGDVEYAGGNIWATRRVLSDPPKGQVVRYPGRVAGR